MINSETEEQSPSPASALIYVDSNFIPSANKPSNGSSTRPFVSLTQALTFAVNGDTIQIAAGNYGTTSITTIF